MAKLLQIPVWNDNYVYLVANDEPREAFLIDPSESELILEWIEQLGVTLRAILNTHHHPDHVGGNLEIQAATGCDIYGPAHDKDRIPGLTHPVEVGETVTVIGQKLRVLDVRAHTRGHICYALDAPLQAVIRQGHDGGECVDVPAFKGRGALFVGDSLFMAGCGRLFEGTPEQLRASMEVLAAEDPAKIICCAHEYTQSNLRFAHHVLPEHKRIRKRLDQLPEVRGKAHSSVPDTLKQELATNPFLMALDERHRPALAAAVDADPDDVTDVLGKLRAAKDAF